MLLAPNPHAVKRPDITSYELRLFVTFREAAGEFAAGDINALLATTPEELSTLLAVKGAQAEGMTTPGFVDLMFNERVGGLTDSVVRHAIGIAINRSAVVSGALEGSSGVVETGPFSDGLPWVGSSTLESVSPAVADEVLQGDGWVVRVRRNAAQGRLQAGLHPRRAGDRPAAHRRRRAGDAAESDRCPGHGRRRWRRRTS